MTGSDQIFIVESSISHQGGRKSLIWEKVRHRQRFAFVDQNKEQMRYQPSILRTMQMRDI